jgi:RNA-directed DNA polymerase
MITPITTPHDLAQFLGTNYSKLTYVVYGKGVNQFYKTFEISKKNGEKRTIRAPYPQLKMLQQRLKILLEELYTPHSAASAFIEGRGIVYNAQQHTKKAAVFNVDLKGFYDQIHFGRVRGLLMAKPYSLQKDTAQLIAHICCVNKVLPQGAPTSPVLSNMICRRLDRELSLLARSNKAYYSRYADDITFSFRSCSENSIYEIEQNGVKAAESLEKIIEGNWFSLNVNKTRLQTFSERQVVTGLKVNRKVNLDRRYIRKTRAMIHSLSKGVDEAHAFYSQQVGEDVAHLGNVVHGRLNFIGMVKGRESSVYQTLAQKFNNLDLVLKASTEPSSKNVKLENALHFYSYEHKSRLERSVWVVSFEGIEGLELEEELVQGSAFMVKGQKIFTTAHTFEKAGNPSECFLYRITEPGVKYKAKIISKCTTSDIAQLEFLDNELPMLSYLNFAPKLEPHTGYKLSVIGFPQLLSGHLSVSIMPCTVTNTFNMSTFKYGEVDVVISAGNSGGPVVNAYMQVVGMATMGTDVSSEVSSEVSVDENETKVNVDVDVKLEGTNAFISAKHFADLEPKLVLKTS